MRLNLQISFVIYWKELEVYYRPFLFIFIFFLYHTKKNIESNEVPREYEPLPAYQGGSSQPADDLPPQYSA